MRTLTLTLVAVLMSTTAVAEEYDRYRGSCRPVGSWLINVQFPDIVLPTGSPLMFQQLLSLNADRTLEETNSGLHPNTNPIAAPPGSPPITGSDGFGAWKRLPGCRIRFTQWKFVFAGEAPPMPMAPNSESAGTAMPPTPPGLPIGFFKVSGVAKIRGNSYISELGAVEAKLIFGFDPFDPNAMAVPFGDSIGFGTRLLAND